MSAAVETVTPERSTPATYRDYSAEFKADALLTLTANDNNVYKTAKQLGIAQSLLRYWVEQETDECRKIREGRKGELAQQFEHLARVYVDRALEPDAIQKTTGYAAVLAASDAVKSSQLLRNQPTSIVLVVSHDDLRQAQETVQAIAASERLTLYDAATRLVAELADVPELAAQVQAWAEGSLRDK